MAPSHLQHGIRPALQGCGRSTPFASPSIASSRQRLALSHSVRAMSWWGKKTTLDSRFRRRRYADSRPSEMDAGASQRGAESTRCFSKAKTDKGSGSSGWHDHINPFLERHEMMRRRTEDAWRKMVEKDPYQALFGHSESMLRGRGWRPLWEEVFGTQKGEETQKKPASRNGPGDFSHSQFVYDPISGRMVMKQVQETNTPFWSATSNSIGIPVKPFNASSKHHQEEDPLDSLHRALGEYDSKNGLKTSGVMKKHTDPVRESLNDYDSRPRQSSYKPPVEEVDPLQEALKEYSAKSKQSTSNYTPPTEPVDPLQKALAEYTPEASKSTSQIPVEQVDPLQEALAEYSPSSKQPKPSYPVETADPLQDALREYDVKSKLSTTKVFTATSDPLQKALQEYEMGSQKPITLSEVTEADTLNACLSDYESRLKKNSQVKTTSVTDNHQDRPLEYERGNASSSNFAQSATESLENCLREYDLKADQAPKTTSTLAAATETDPLRECLREYESQPRRNVPIVAAPEIDPLQECLREYETKPKKATRAPVVEQSNSVHDHLLEYEAGKGGNIYKFSPDPNDPFYSQAKSQHRARLEREFDQVSNGSNSEVIQKPKTPQPIQTQSKEGATVSIWDGRVDSDIHECLKAYEESSPKKAYQFTPCNDLVFDIPTPQGCTTSVTPIATPANSEDKTSPEVKSLISRNPQSIILIYDKTTSQVTAKSFSFGLDKPLEGAHASTSFRQHDEFPLHFSAYTPLLENFKIIEYTPDTVLLQRRRESSQGTTPSEPMANKMESAAELLSSNARSILCTYEDSPKRLLIKTSSSDISGRTEALSPAEALTEFAHPSLFFPYIPLLEEYDIVQCDRALLVLRKRGSATEESYNVVKPSTNPVDGTTISFPEAPTGSFASPTGFVNYSTSAIASTEQPLVESIEEKPVKQRNEQNNSKKKRGGGAASVAKAAIWAGTACYITGVVGELMK